ncbi:MAG TPA: amidohydrolase [Vicinamibacterales bacterium]|jgi:predicted amidohydrolase YtcJ|nr:amidohydrolase [Vicinamibacterales bacterium]
MAARITTYVVVGIVAATLIAGLIVGAQRDDNDGPVDLIIHNAKVFTANGRNDIAEAVAIRGNQILRVGSDREINRLRKPQTQVIDAKGGTVLPGFNDAHVRFITGGLALDRIDLADAADAGEVQRRIREWAEANPDRPWVLGGGWTYQAFEGLPTRQLLDAIVRDRPAQLVSRDGHVAWVNSAALKLARITRRTPNPENGTIVRDARTGEPTGVLKDAAIALVSRHVPAASAEERARALRSAVTEAHKNGITSVQHLADASDDLDTFEEARRSGDLQVRVYAAIPVDRMPSDADLDRLDQLAAKYPDDPLFKSGAVHVTVDGIVEVNSAALLEPYANEPGNGSTRWTPDDFNRLVRMLDARGWQIVADASGDRAVQIALTAFEHAVRSNPAPARGRRHRVERVEIAADEDLPRFGALGVIASMQPGRGMPGDALALWTHNLGDRASHGWPYHAIARAHGRLAFGSDWPAASLSPLTGVHVAVNRTTPDGLPEGGWQVEDALTLDAALDAYTSGAAWASFDEQRKGTIAAGMLADLVVLGGDIFRAPSDRLASTTVNLTIFDGKIVYSRAAQRSLTDAPLTP